MLKLKNKVIALFAALTVFGAAQAGEVEVLHYWTSGGEAKSVNELKRLLEAKGHSWKDFAVAGGGGESAMTVLKARALSGSAPTAAQVKGPSIQEWAELGLLADMSATAEAGNWDELLPGVVSDVMKHDGKYVAAPVNVHRVNWLWANPEAFAKAGAKIPTNWDEFFTAADKLAAAGITPVAHGGQPWQDFTVFESVVLGVGGAEFYNKVFVELDESAMTSSAMIESLEVFQRIKTYLDPGHPGRDWNVATGMVIEGKAGMQFMGDWAKGEFTAAGKVPGTDYVCLPSPGTATAFTFNIDSFILFDQKSKSSADAQAALAATIMEPEFQEIFNLNKGSIPARLNMAKTNFDSCATSSMDDFVTSAQTQELVPSVAHGMATYDAVKGAMQDVVTGYFNSRSGAPKTVANRLANAVKAAKAQL